MRLLTKISVKVKIQSLIKVFLLLYIIPLSELELELASINWSTELVEDLGSKLYPLWNRTAGDCLLDSVLQATWGVVDRESTLRRAMADSLNDASSR